MKHKIDCATNSIGQVDEASGMGCTCKVEKRSRGLMRLKTKYKFVQFGEIPSKTRERKEYFCHLTHYPLGFVEWDAVWRQYIFTPSGSDIILPTKCLLDIVDFINQLNAKEQK